MVSLSVAFKVIREKSGRYSMSAKEQGGHLLTEDEVLLVLRRTYGKGKFRVIRYSVRPVSGDTAGFLGEHHRLSTEVILEDEDFRRDERSYFVKRMPFAMPEQAEYAVKTRAFYKEIQMYETLFRDAKNAGVDVAKWHPEYYLSRGEELFVVEDLASSGYRMYPERMLLDEDHIQASVEKMAAMHAASIIFEERYRAGSAEKLSPSAHRNRDRKNVTLGDIYAHLTFETEISDVDGHPGNAFCEVGMRSQLAIVDLLEGYTDHEKKKIREKLPAALRRIFTLVKPSDRYRNVFVHGDLWSNNLLFRKNRDGKVEAIIIDFQLARYSPPAQDLIMFIHLVQNKCFRKRYREKVLDSYYAALSGELRKNGIEPESVLPEGEFRESCDFYEELGAAIAILYFQLILAPAKTANEFMSSPEEYRKVMLFDRSEMVKKCFLEDSVCKNRMTEAMKTFIDRYILS